MCMLTIYGANTFNPIKVLLTAEEMGLDYKFQPINLGKLENKSPDYLSMNPQGKVPLLDHDGKFIIESNTICRYLAAINNNTLYANDPYEAAQIDGAIDTVTQHIGQWMGLIFWEEVIKKMYFQKPADESRCEDAKKFLSLSLPNLDNRLEDKTFLTGDKITIADTICFAYCQLQEITSLDFENYNNISRWYSDFNQRPSVSQVKALFNPA